MRFHPRYLATGFQTLIVVVGHLWLNLLPSWEQFLIAVGVALAAEAVLGRLYWGKWPNLISGYMAGVSIGILVRSPLIWPYVVGSLLSIAQKYAIRFRGRHLFNPSNFGLCVLLLTAPEAVAALSKQLTNLPIVIGFLFAFGVVVIGRLGRLDAVGAYLAVFLPLSLARSAVNGTPWVAELAPLVGPMYQIFLFFMLTDPKTTPADRRGRVLFGVAVAIVEALLRWAQVVNAPFFAVFLVTPIAVIVETLLRERAPAPGGNGGRDHRERRAVEPVHVHRGSDRAGAGGGGSAGA